MAPGYGFWAMTPHEMRRRARELLDRAEDPGCDDSERQDLKITARQLVVTADELDEIAAEKQRLAAGRLLKT